MGGSKLDANTYLKWITFKCKSTHVTDRYANNRAEQSHEGTRVRERSMRRFKTEVQVQRFLGVHSAIYNLFNLGRHMIRAHHYRELRLRAFASWKEVTAA